MIQKCRITEKNVRRREIPDICIFRAYRHDIFNYVLRSTIAFGFSLRYALTKLTPNLSGDSTLSGLVEAEHVAKTADGRYVLTEDGQMIAKGALDIYPELQQS